MFAYANELRRRDKFKEFMENWLEGIHASLYRYDKFNEVYPEWLKTEKNIIEGLLMEFNK